MCEAGLCLGMSDLGWFGMGSAAVVLGREQHAIRVCDVHASSDSPRHMKRIQTATLRISTECQHHEAGGKSNLQWCRAVYL